MLLLRVGNVESRTGDDDVLLDANNADDVEGDESLEIILALLLLPLPLRKQDRRRNILGCLSTVNYYYFRI